LLEVPEKRGILHTRQRKLIGCLAAVSPWQRNKQQCWWCYYWQ